MAGFPARPQVHFQLMRKLGIAPTTNAAMVAVVAFTWPTPYRPVSTNWDNAVERIELAVNLPNRTPAVRLGSSRRQPVRLRARAGVPEALEYPSVTTTTDILTCGLRCWYAAPCL